MRHKSCPLSNANGEGVTGVRLKEHKTNINYVFFIEFDAEESVRKLVFVLPIFGDELP